jgi:hypothetical protein
MLPNFYGFTIPRQVKGIAVMYFLNRLCIAISKNPHAG